MGGGCILFPLARMQKDFDGWNTIKKNVDEHAHAPLYHEGEVRWCRLGTNIGFEQDGTGDGRSRPVLIVKRFSREVCWVVPLTTSQKKNPYHFSIGMVGERDAFVIISQLRLVDTRRLNPLLAHVSPALLGAVRKAVKALL